MIDTVSNTNLPPGARYAPPRASAMIEALRGIGYSPATAVADIVDNSISARAGLVELDFAWKGGGSHVSILDDGSGMDADELDSAMRLGERSPLDQRASDDLGRFGLGLKTASFSQCRRLTVASIKGGCLNCLRWDLDLIGSNPNDDWLLFEGPSKESESLLEPLLRSGRGTMVLWERLDKIVTPDFAEQDFLDLMDAVEQHLAMVYHRFLEDSHSDLQISMNGRAVSPWDPFLKGHPATWSSSLERFSGPSGVLEVQCHVLPHKDHLAARLEGSAAGPRGWTAQQGFYVYRNRRLLLAGSWLGLGQGRLWTKEEAHRLARIQLDIPNSADAEWKIDIRKSTASPPVRLREQLTRLAEDTRDRARRVFAHRGQPASVRGSHPVMQAWRAEHSGNGIRYRIEYEHPAVRTVLDGAGDLSIKIKAMLRVIEATVPVQRIWLDTTEGRETPRKGFAGEPLSEVHDVLMVMYCNLVLHKGASPEIAREQLLRTEPFNDYPDLVANLPAKPQLGEEHDIGK